MSRLSGLDAMWIDPPGPVGQTVATTAILPRQMDFVPDMADPRTAATLRFSGIYVFQGPVSPDLNL